ncbi:MAG: hypothetical protein ORN25_08950 [Caulobacteraceae bacterium]|nr:hypothetical protein [Caulobacteraceae bacterium]
MKQTSRPAVVFALSLLVLLSLVPMSQALAKGREATSEPAKPPVSDRMGQAVKAPLEDLNLTKNKIPLILEQAMAAPYQWPEDSSCDGLAAAIAPLTLALGPDLDVPPTKTNPGLLERGSTLAGDTAVDVVRGAAQSVIPFRGWVRKLTGAEAYAKMVRAAITAGGVRRAYLKGLGEAKGCAAPAAALHALPPPAQP